MIRVIDPAMRHLLDEKQVVLDDDHGDHNRIVIHPWVRHQPSVAVALGALKKDGTPKHVSKKGGGDEDGTRCEMAIFDRADFVEAILAVFPELQRAAEAPHPKAPEMFKNEGSVGGESFHLENPEGWIAMHGGGIWQGDDEESRHTFLPPDDAIRLSSALLHWAVRVKGGEQ